MALDVSYLTRSKSGESLSGDAVVIRTDVTPALLAVVDALGHGPIAAEAATKASRYLQSIPTDSELRKIVTGLHAELRGTRGAAAMICLVAGERIEGCGVGNVELRISGGSVPVVLSPGILGSNVRQFRIFQGALAPHSRMVLFSDGISARFSLDQLRLLAPEEACRRLMAEYGRSHDDATVLVADCA